jgi:hypothetical protein
MAFRPILCGMAEAMPFAKRCRSKLFAQFDFAREEEMTGR